MYKISGEITLFTLPVVISNSFWEAQNELEITTGNVNRVISPLILYIVLSRCLCGHCWPIDTVQESVCCNEIDNINDLLVGDPLPSCTAYPEFAKACLNRMVLNIAFHAYRHHYGISDVPSDENR